MHQMGVATISRLLKIIGLFCRRSSLLQGSFGKETYNFKEPSNRSHPITTSDASDGVSPAVICVQDLLFEGLLQCVLQCVAVCVAVCCSVLQCVYI